MGKLSTFSGNAFDSDGTLFDKSGEVLRQLRVHHYRIFDNDGRIIKYFSTNSGNCFCQILIFDRIRFRQIWEALINRGFSTNLQVYCTVKFRQNRTLESANLNITFDRSERYVL